MLATVPSLDDPLSWHDDTSYAKNGSLFILFDMIIPSETLPLFLLLDVSGIAKDALVHVAIYSS